MSENFLHISNSKCLSMKLLNLLTVESNFEITFWWLKLGYHNIKHVLINTIKFRSMPYLKGVSSPKLLY